MNAPTPPTDNALPLESSREVEINKVLEENIPKRPASIGTDVERIRGSVRRLASNSIEGLAALTAELQEVQRFLNSEIERVQFDIESSLAGINIIMETIAPWKGSPVSAVAPTSSRLLRAAPTANIPAQKIKSS